MEHARPAPNRRAQGLVAFDERRKLREACQGNEFGRSRRVVKRVQQRDGKGRRAQPQRSLAELKGKPFRTEGCGPQTDESAPDARAGWIDLLSSVSLLPFLL